MSNSSHICKQCHHHGSDKYCSHCGQPFAIKKITLGSILHDVFHFFSHLEKGFPFTLKKLVTEPGTMQRLYIEGHRVRHQKPFSMYFLCATGAALIYYWINLALVNWFHAGNNNTVHFFHQYMVLLQIGLLPVYTFITWLFFRNSRYNFAETLVLLLYSFGVILLIASLLQLLKFFSPDLQTRYLELPLITLYIIVTNVRFFNDSKKSVVIIKSIISTALSFAVAGMVQDWLIQKL